MLVVLHQSHRSKSCHDSLAIRVAIVANCRDDVSFDLEDGDGLNAVEEKCDRSWLARLNLNVD
jgi:hypothetical protein